VLRMLARAALECLAGATVPGGRVEYRRKAGADGGDGWVGVTLVFVCHAVPDDVAGVRAAAKARAVGRAGRVVRPMGGRGFVDHGGGR